MGVTSEKDLSKEELAELRGDTPRQKAENIARRGSLLIAPVATVGLALLFSLTGTGLGEIGGAFLLVNSSKIFTVLGKFAPKR